MSNRYTIFIIAAILNALCESSGEIIPSQSVPVAPENVYKIQYPAYSNSGPNGYVLPQFGLTDLANSLNSIENEGISSTVINYMSSILPLVPNYALHFAVKIGTFTLAVLLAIIVGTTITTGLCTYTSICKIQFAGVEWQNHQLDESVRAFLTPEKLSSLSEYVNKAIKKYKEKLSKSTEKLTKTRR